MDELKDSHWKQQMQHIMMSLLDGLTPPCLTNLTNIQLMLLLLMMQLGCEAPVQYIQQDAVLNIWSWAGHNVIYIDI